MRILAASGVGTEAEIIEIKKTLTAMKDRGDVTEGGAIAGRQFGGKVTSADIANELASGAAAAGIITEGQASAMADPVEGAKIFNALMQNNALFKKFVDDATHPGSIYVHDIHTEKLQKSMQGDLSSQLAVMKKGSGIPGLTATPASYDISGGSSQVAGQAGEVAAAYDRWGATWNKEQDAEGMKPIKEKSAAQLAWERNDNYTTSSGETVHAPRTRSPDAIAAALAEQDAAYQAAGGDRPPGGAAAMNPRKPPGWSDAEYASAMNERPKPGKVYADGSTQSQVNALASQSYQEPAMGGNGTMAGGNLTELKAMIDTLNRVADGMVISVAMPPIEVILNTAGFTDQMTNIVTKLALDAMSNQLPVIIEDRKTEVLRALGMENA